MNVTLDGFLSGPHCELDWHFQSWTSNMAEALTMQLSCADTILLGRATYAAMAEYWPSKALDLSCPREDLAFAEMMNRYIKVVVSKSRIVTGWSNTQVLNGNLEDEIGQLKKMHGRDIIVYGSGRLASALLRLGLVDEYQLWLHPVAIGKGKPLFGSLHPVQQLHLIEVRMFSSGVVLLSYRCRHDDIKANIAPASFVDNGTPIKRF